MLYFGTPLFPPKIFHSYLYFFSSGQSNLAINTPYGPGMSPQPGFSCRNVWKPLTINFIGGQTKEIYLDVSDRGEVPQISDGYCISLAYVILLDVVRSLAIVFDKNEESKKECHQPLLGINYKYNY